jgi:hypothetical protein
MNVEEEGANEKRQSELNKTVAVVATALRAVFLDVKSSAEANRLQAGGYSICEIALMTRSE